MKGGVGKTTLSTNVAHCLALHDNKKVLIVDIDPQFNATQCFFTGNNYVEYMKSEGSTIIELFRGNVSNVSSVEGTMLQRQKSFQDILPFKINDNLYILPGDLNLYQVEISAGSGKENRLKKYLEAIEPIYNFDYVIVDTPPTPSIWMISALVASNYYIIPVKPDPLSYTGISLLQNIVRQKTMDLDLKIECLGIVLTMIEEGTIVYNSCIKTINQTSELKGLLFSKGINKRTEIPKQQLNQKFILDINKSDLKLSLASIVSEMQDRIRKYEEHK